MESTINETNLEVAMEVLADVMREFPLKSVKTRFDEFTNLEANHVHYVCKKLQEKYNERASELMDLRYEKYAEERREMGKEAQIEGE